MAINNHNTPLGFIVSGLALVLCSAALYMTPYFFLAPLLILALVGGFYLYRHPEVGLMIVIFLIPFEIYKEILSKYKFLTISKLIGIAIVLIVILRILQGSLKGKDLASPMWMPMIFLVLVYGISSALSINLMISLNSTRQLITAISIFALGLLLVKNIGYTNVIRFIVLSVAMTAGMSLMQGVAGGLENRTSGFLEDPNFFALLAVVSTPLAVYLLQTEKNILVRLLVAVCLVVLIVASVKTFSRSAFLVLLVTLIAGCFHYRHLFVYLKKPKYWGFLILLAAMGLPVLVSVVPAEYVDRIASLVNIGEGTQTTQDRSLGRRTSYIFVGMKALKENPVLGSGPGTFPINYSKTPFASAFSLDDGKPNIYRRAHNTYLEVLSETGIVGFSLFVGIVVWGMFNFRYAQNRFKQLGDNGNYQLVSHFLLAFVALSLFLLFLSSPNHKYLWFFLAISQALRNDADIKQLKANSREGCSDPDLKLSGRSS
ncbi:O-antigen ligase family protein [Alkalimarinus coralli]|uniref:O-antigen ligase family protein n=1 Tax=Alkalimarinus coralli TaxID=2935863 RepID=UPI00202B6881|nr:O-antigen ligase family protein [Alkalimarinus coralli]